MEERNEWFLEMEKWEERLIQVAWELWIELV